LAFKSVLFSCMELSNTQKEHVHRIWYRKRIILFIDIDRCKIEIWPPQKNNPMAALYILSQFSGRWPRWWKLKIYTVEYKTCNNRSYHHFFFFFLVCFISRPVLVGSCYSIFSFMCMFCRSLCVLFLLAIVFSVLLRYTDSDYSFGIFKLFLFKCTRFLTNVIIIK